MKQPPRYANAVCRARDLINELQILDPREITIEDIAPYKGAPVRYAELTGCDGRMVRSGDTAIITVRDSIKRTGQKRFVIAHELGHVLLHPDIYQLDEVDSSQTRNFSHYQKPEELEANYFAAELLMPKKFLEPDAKGREPSWDLVSELAEKYQTTLTSTAIQYIHCAKEALYLVASENGQRKWFATNDRTDGFWLTDDFAVHRYSCARELLESSETRSRGSIPAGAWLNNFDPNAKEMIVEDSMRAKNSTFLLSLLWINEEI